MGYLRVVYAEESVPYLSYPNKLCKHIAENYFKSHYKTLLDVGCGRGEHLRGFRGLGYQVAGADLSIESKILSPDMQIGITDVEEEPLPFGNNSFDVVFSKSLVEHLANPKNFMEEAYRVLKIGGRLITMTPDWESGYRIFYEDYTHKTPFTKNSLYNIQKVCSFRGIKVKKFKQLPILWKYPFLNVLSKLASYLPQSKIKFIRFSKEIMLLSCAEK